MRAIPASLADRLDGATTLCRCWRLLLSDGTRLGFTDHDRDLAFDGTTFAAATGLDATATESALGFAIGGGDVSGALVAASITEEDLAGGRYDAAGIETWLVDWTNVDARLLFDVGTIGEVHRSEFAFTAEVRSRAADFDEPTGRYFQRGCAADLGDARCGIDLSNAAFRTAGTVLATDGRLMLSAEIEGFADGFFTGGIVQFQSGAQGGRKHLIKSQRVNGATHSFVFWAPLLPAIAVGDTFFVTAGCDKALATCRAKFANVPNFRGFPHMPGNDVLMSYPNASDPVMDGGSLFR